MTLLATGLDCKEKSYLAKVMRGKRLKVPNPHRAFEKIGQDELTAHTTSRDFGIFAD